jgi:plastocyanin
MSRGCRVAVACVCALAGLVVGTVSAAAGPDDSVGTPAILAVPGSRAGTYATPVVIAQPGDDLTFMNLELFPHDVRSRAKGPDDTPWCNPANPKEPQHAVRNPRQFPIGKCPLLWTPSISITVGAFETKVYGTGNLRPGTSIDFYCTVFKNMKGTVVVP